MDTHTHGYTPPPRKSDRERRSAVLTAKIQGREKSYGTYLYVGLSREVERGMGWRRGDLVQLILDKERDFIILKRIFRVDEARVKFLGLPL